MYVAEECDGENVLIVLLDQKSMVPNSSAVYLDNCSLITRNISSQVLKNPD